MNPRKRRQQLGRMILAGVCLICALTVAKAAEVHAVAVVVSPKNSTSSLTLAELRKTFAGEKRTWFDGSKIRLFSRAPGTPERTTLLKLLGKSETEYKQYWTGKVYQGDAEAEPMVLPSNGMQREALTAYPGAIALVDSGDVKPGMKVLKIDGKLPEDPNYPLH